MQMLHEICMQKNELVLFLGHLHTFKLFVASFGQVITQT